MESKVHDGFPPLRYPPSRNEVRWEVPPHSTEVYMPMLSVNVNDFTRSDLKLYEQWIVRRKRIMYFLALLTVVAVCLCAVSMLYVIPRMYGDCKTTSETDDFRDLPIPDNFPDSAVQSKGAYQDDLSEEASIGFPTLQAEDISSLLNAEHLDGNEEHVYCVVSALPEYRQFPKSCNAVVFKELSISDPTQYFTDTDLNKNDIAYVRISSPLSESLVRKIVETFPRLQKLTVSIDKLCFGSEEKDKNNLPVVELPQLETLEIVNATLCPLTSWLLNKWNMPSIEKISITQADIPKPIFESLTGFIEKHSQTLTSVQFTNCFFGDCDTASLQENSHNLTVVETLPRLISAF